MFSGSAVTEHQKRPRHTYDSKMYGGRPKLQEMLKAMRWEFKSICWKKTICYPTVDQLRRECWQSSHGMFSSWLLLPYNIIHNADMNFMFIYEIKIYCMRWNDVVYSEGNQCRILILFFVSKSRAEFYAKSTYINAAKDEFYAKNHTKST
jgi:hypothetical protein